MKRFYILMLITFLMLSSVSLAYTDIEGHWAQKNIESLSRINIIKGYSDETFRPDEYITRAELITIVNRLLKNTEQSYKYIPDVASDDWYSGEVRKAMYSGIVQGNDNGMVRPNAYITREEAVVILQRAFVKNLPAYNTISYKDIGEVSDWSKEAYYTFINLGYISGYDDNTVRPKANITRAEIVKIINNIFAEIVFLGEYNQEVHGNLLASGENIKLTDVIIDGDLVVTEGTNGTLTLDNVAILGNLILRTPLEIDNKKVSVNGKIINLYETVAAERGNVYINEQYGIRFSIPENGTVVEITQSTKNIDYDKDNLVTLIVNKSDELHFVSFKDALNKEKQRFALIYNEIKVGKIGLADYAICGDGEDSYFVFIKRDDVEYAMYFYNIDDYNVVDNLVNSIELYAGELIHVHEMKVYKNPGLYLKFSYLDYVGVDDSYNTGNRFEGESYFKFFIQVNNVTDMSEYSLEDLKLILRTMEGNNVKILDTETKKVYQYDAIEFTTQEDGKISKSLYIIIETKLYHFIFVGDAEKMMSIGEEIYDDIVNTIEF